MRRLVSLCVVAVLAGVSLTVSFGGQVSALGGSFDWVSPNYSGGVLNDPSNGAGRVQQGLSADGRYALFVTGATDAVANDTNGFRDLFLRDRQTDTTTLVSVGSAGQQGNADIANQTAISGDGRYVAFTTNATNFASPDFNSAPDLFLRDTQAGTTTRICTSQFSGFGCSGVSISTDGNYITYTTANPFNFGGVTQLYRYERATGTTLHVSQNDQGAVANGNVGLNRLSADGRYVVFESGANNLVAGDTNNKQDIFRRDMQTGEIIRISTTTAGAQANNDSQWPTVSADGRYVTFTSTASNFVAGDTNSNWDLFVKDIDLGTVQVVGGSLNLSQEGAITGDGAFIVFSSSVVFSPTDTDPYQDAYLYDRVANTTVRISEHADGSELGVFGNGVGATSTDGRYALLFTNNMIDPGDTQAAQEVYVYDRGPAAPTGLVAASPTKQPVLTWSAVAGANSYKVYRNGSHIASPAGTTYTDTTAPNGTVSYYVTAVSNGIESSPSNTINVLVDTVRPVMAYTAPASFSTPFTTGPTVTVTASDSGSGLQILVIHVYNSANQLLSICGTATPAQLSAGMMSCDLSPLPNGTYSIKAGSFDLAGNNKTISSGSFTISQ